MQATPATSNLLPTLSAALRGTLGPAAGHTAVLQVGSFPEPDVHFQECDIVVLSETDAGLERALRIIHSVGVNLGARTQLITAFAPRSYSHRLTLHVASYTLAALRRQRPRLALDLPSALPLYGDLLFAASLVDTSWRCGDLLWERWGVLHALEILGAGELTVPRHHFQNGKLVVSPYCLELTRPEVFAETLWYFASKLTSNLSLYVGRSEKQRLEIHLAPLRSAIASARTGNAAVNDAATALRSLWPDWLRVFVHTFRSAPQEARSSLKA